MKRSRIVTVDYMVYEQNGSFVWPGKDCRLDRISDAHDPWRIQFDRGGHREAANPKYRPEYEFSHITEWSPKLKKFEKGSLANQEPNQSTEVNDMGLLGYGEESDKRPLRTTLTVRFGSALEAACRSVKSAHRRPIWWTCRNTLGTFQGDS